MRYRNGILIFPSDGINRIRFTGQGQKPNLSRIRPAPRRRICLCWGYCSQSREECQEGKIRRGNCNRAYRNRCTSWLPLWGSWLPRKGQTERASMADFCCHYLTVAPSQSACSADSSPKGRAKGRCRICPPNYILAKNQNKKRCRKPAAHFICHRNQTARSTLLERRHLVQAYTWQGVPFTTAFTRLTLGFHSRLERLWEWETLIPKVTPLPQKSHFAIHCTSHPN